MLYTNNDFKPSEIKIFLLNPDFYEYTCLTFIK